MNRITGYLKERQETKHWEKGGRVGPPPGLFKRRTIIEYGKDYSIEILVETGTYLGDTVAATRHAMKMVYSIELDESLYRQAKSRFEKDRNVSILHGDSGTILPKLASEIEEPILFWLDGHYSGGTTAKGSRDTPIVSELQAIRQRPLLDVILIDDARLFVGMNDYPTMTEMRGMIGQWFPNHRFDMKDDIIRITPLDKTSP